MLSFINICVIELPLLHHFQINPLITLFHNQTLQMPLYFNFMFCYDSFPRYLRFVLLNLSYLFVFSFNFHVKRSLSQQFQLDSIPLCVSRVSHNTFPGLDVMMVWFLQLYCLSLQFFILSSNRSHVWFSIFLVYLSFCAFIFYLLRFSPCNIISNLTILLFSFEWIFFIHIDRILNSLCISLLKSLIFLSE